MGSFFISDQAIDVAAMTAALENPGAGALATFEGRVRDHNQGKPVTGLTYEVFRPLAEAEGRRIVAEAGARFGLCGARAMHRQGDLRIGDCAVWIGVTAPHRDQAFAAARYIIDEVKRRLPIWKKETYRDGTGQWVNCHHHDAACFAADHPPHDLSDYYARQMRLPEIGVAGQARLSKAKIAVVGIGGLGSSAALCLASAGIGTIGLIDHDRLEASNLHRQMIYPASAIGEPKTRAAAAQLRAHNPLITIVEHDEKLAAGNARRLLGGYDMILDCTDNFAAKYLLNDAAVMLGKYLVQASIHRFEGRLMAIDPAGRGGCLRCIAPPPPDQAMAGDCADAGVLGTVPAVFGGLQANEAIKHALGMASAAADHLLLFDLISLQSHFLGRQKKPGCSACGQTPSLIEPEENMTSSLEFTPAAADSFNALAARFSLVDVREEDEAALIAGTVRVPLSRLQPDHFPVAKDRPVLLFCARGQRSLQAAALLSAAGWTQAYSLRGGAPALPADRPAA